MNRRITLILFGIVAAAAIAAGCGSGSSDDGSVSDSSAGGGGSTVALTKAEFIAQSDAICAKANKTTKAEFDAYAKAHDFPENKEPSKAQQEKMIATIALPSIAAQGDELAELGAPSGEEEEVDDIVEGLQKAVKTAEADPSLVFSRNGPFTEVNKLAKDYGLKVCGQ